MVFRRIENAGNRVRWACQCDCGKQVNVLGSSLRPGVTVSCGCSKREKARVSGRRNKTHCMTRTPAYQSWSGMKDRCLNKNDHAYERYGGRGIKVCERWMKFENFLADMGEKPDGQSIDRIDNDGDYEPSNCRWATCAQQNLNKRNSRRAKYKGETIPLIEISRLSGLKYGPFITGRCGGFGVNDRPQTINAIFHLAQERLNEIKTPESLAWDE